MSSNKLKVAFLDRDGVINKEVNYLHKVEDFQYTHQFKKGIKKLIELGYEVIIVTNQAGIAKGLFQLEDYLTLTSWYIKDLKNDNIDILDVYHCPHHPLGIVPRLSYHCKCRKPQPGMLLEASIAHNIDMENSILIGDKVSDAQSGLNAGLNQVFLVNTGHDIDTNIWSDPIYDSVLSVANMLALQHD